MEELKRLQDVHNASNKADTQIWNEIFWWDFLHNLLQNWNIAINFHFFDEIYHSLKNAVIQQKSSTNEGLIAQFLEYSCNNDLDILDFIKWILEKIKENKIQEEINRIIKEYVFDLNKTYSDKNQDIIAKP